MYSIRLHYTVFATILAVLLLSFVVFGFNPRLTEIGRLRTREMDLQAQLDKRLEMDRQAGRLAPQELEAMTRLAEVVRTRLPEDDDTAEFMAVVSGLADEEGLGNVIFSLGEATEFLNLEIPDEKGEAGTYACRRIPLQLEMVTDYHGLLVLVRRLTELERIVAVDHLDLRRAGERIMVTMKLMVYSLRPETR